MPDPFNPELMQQMVARELQQHPPQDQKPFNLGVEPSSMTPSWNLSPERLATIGGMADIAGTYGGLRRGWGENNAMYSGIGGELGVGAALGTQLAVQKGITGLLRHYGHPKIADAIAANAGARQLGAGADWASILNGQSHPVSGHEHYNAALQSGLARK